MAGCGPPCRVHRSRQAGRVLRDSGRRKGASAARSADPAFLFGDPRTPRRGGRHRACSSGSASLHSRARVISVTSFVKKAKPPLIVVLSGYPGLLDNTLPLTPDGTDVARENIF